MLLTCPFCGAEPVYVYRKQFDEWFIACPTPECAAKVGWLLTKNSHLAARSKPEIADRWNSTLVRSAIASPEVRQV